MAIPKIPAASAKLFRKKRMRRQVVVDSSQMEEAIDKNSPSDTIPAVAEPVQVRPVAASAPATLRRRG